MSSAYIPDLNKISAPGAPFPAPVAKVTSTPALTNTLVKAAAQLPILQTQPVATNPKVQAALTLLTEEDQKDLCAMLTSKWGTKEAQQIAEIRKADGILKKAEVECATAKKSFEEAQEKTRIGRDKFEKKKNKTEISYGDLLASVENLNNSQGSHCVMAFHQHMAEEGQRWAPNLTLDQMFQLVEGQGQRAEEAANKAHHDAERMYPLDRAQDPIKSSEDLLKKDQEETLTFAKELKGLVEVENEAKKRLDAAKESLRKAQENLLNLIREKMGSDLTTDF